MGATYSIKKEEKEHKKCNKVLMKKRKTVDNSLEKKRMLLIVRAFPYPPHDAYKIVSYPCWGRDEDIIHKGI